MARLVNLDNFTQFTAINLLTDPGYDGSDRHIPNTAQITLVWTTEGGGVAHNVLHGSYTGGFHGSQAEGNAIMTALTSGANWTALAAFLAPATTLGRIIIRDLNVENAAVILSSNAAVPGTSASPALPREVAAVITLRTAQAGKAFRGRMYVPGWATNALGVGNVISAPAVTALNNWGLIVAGALAGSGYTFGVAHFSRIAYTGANGVHHDARPPGLVPITSVDVRDNHWDSQRRRGLK